jgi:hypothetical protein
MQRSSSSRRRRHCGMEPKRQRSDTEPPHKTRYDCCKVAHIDARFMSELCSTTKDYGPVDLFRSVGHSLLLKPFCDVIITRSECYSQTHTNHCSSIPTTDFAPFHRLPRRPLTTTSRTMVHEDDYYYDDDDNVPMNGPSLVVVRRRPLDAAVGPPSSSSRRSPSSVVVTTPTTTVVDNNGCCATTIRYHRDHDTSIPGEAAARPDDHHSKLSLLKQPDDDNYYYSLLLPNLMLPPEPQPQSTTTTTTTATTSSTTLQQQPQRRQLPWYRAGGMEVNLNGMAINTIVSLCLLLWQTVVVVCSSRDDSDDDDDTTTTTTTMWTKLGATLWLYTWLWNVTLATILTGSRTTYCSVIVPTYFTSLALAWTLSSSSSHQQQQQQQSWWWYHHLHHPMLLILASVVLAVVKINVCMSVCLHRYAAHAAFTCGPVTRLGLLVCGCLANQGGPLWWASHHRCHHKYVLV